MFGLIFRLLCILIGLIYPCYASYKAIKINDATLLERWLMYWVVMGLIGTLEATVEWTVAWIPFYSEVKMLVFVWLALPQIQGSTYVYLTFVHPFLLEHEREIDDTTTRAKAQARAAGMDYIKRALSAVRHGILGQDLANAATALDQASPYLRLRPFCG
ncbi:uncharacterized protein L969DRAFT_19983 [Mixia osmundae IAM 14324]|uniref:uncharacterized protein n=1 Tax=Mixia osmundae (strain CBS 9802 / IAM 14324 / JCM 22182 / KY 12970) TaxID=764103 RepID=UPI0004A54922|nr:uncharacterized protein L969DRAFT_19983 [Mixia osmundae IAM 14324]KEI36591.1 hypothetical protein L969DRAFT_19983 [Mixia osmundae IAM 14324]